MWGLPGSTVVQNLPANAGDVKDTGSISVLKDCQEKEMADHSDILAWEIPWTEESGRLQTLGLQTFGQD